MRRLFATLLAILLCAGCAARQPAAKTVEAVEKKEIPLIYHQVRFSGETLALIAKWYTGDSKNWKQILEVNEDMTPDRIFLDQVIRIPKGIAVRTDSFSLKDLRKMQKPARGVPAEPAPEGFSEAPFIEPVGDGPRQRELREQTRDELLTEMTGK